MVSSARNGAPYIADCTCFVFLQLFDALALLERSYREISRLPEVALASRGEIVIAMATFM